MTTSVTHVRKYYFGCPPYFMSRLFICRSLDTALEYISEEILKSYAMSFVLMKIGIDKLSVMLCTISTPAVVYK